MEGERQGGKQTAVTNEREGETDKLKRRAREGIRSVMDEHHLIGMRDKTEAREGGRRQRCTK